MPTWLDHNLLLGLLFTYSIFWGWWALLRLKSLAGAEALLVSITFTLFQISFSSACLALLNSLHFFHLLAINSVITFLLSTYVLVLKFGGAHKTQEAVIAGGDAFGMLNWCNIILSVLLTFVLLIFVVIGAVFEDISTDGLWIHLPTVLILQQDRELAPSFFPYIAAYPKSVHLWYHWVLIFFGERWVDLGQLPFLGILSLSTSSLARRLGIGKGAARFAGLVCCFAPVVFAQLITTHIDLAVSALLLLCIALLLSWYASGKLFVLLAFYAAASLLLGAKYSTLPQVAILLALSCALNFKRWTARDAMLRSVLGAGVVVLCGAYQYVLNLSRFGNPLYPYQFKILGIEFAAPQQFSEIWVNAQSESLSYFEKLWRSWISVGEVGYGYLYGGLGVLWPIYLLCVCFALWCSIKSDRRLLQLALLFAALFIATPLNFSTRFTIYLLSFGALSLAYLIELVKIPHVRTALLLASLSAAIFVMQQEFSYLRSRIPLFGAGRFETCQRAGFPPGDRAIFKALSSITLETNAELGIFPDTKPYAFYCLLGERKVKIFDPFSTEPPRELPDLLLVSRSSPLYLKFSALFPHYQVQVETENTLLLIRTMS